MATKTADLAEVLEALESLRSDVAHLADRVAALEGTAVRQPPATAVAPSTARPSASPPPPPMLDEELVAVLSAAIGAFLGLKPRIRQIRLLPSGSWAEQGRATIQASHAIPVNHG